MNEMNGFADNICLPVQLFIIYNDLMCKQKLRILVSGTNNLFASIKH